MRKLVLAISVLVGILSIANPAHSVSNENTGVTFFIIDESERDQAINECISLNAYSGVSAKMVGGNCQLMADSETYDVIMESTFLDYWSTTNIINPAMLCKQNDGMWRVFGNLVFALEGCTAFADDITGRDTMVLFLESYGNPADRCDHMGGRYEFIGNPLYFNLRICWGVDF